MGAAADRATNALIPVAVWIVLVLTPALSSERKNSAALAMAAAAARLRAHIPSLAPATRAACSASRMSAPRLRRMSSDKEAPACSGQPRCDRKTEVDSRGDAAGRDPIAIFDDSVFSQSRSHQGKEVAYVPARCGRVTLQQACSSQQQGAGTGAGHEIRRFASRP